MQIALVLGLLVVAVVLFATERISVDVITLSMLTILVMTRVLTAEEAFAGFGSDIVIMLAALFVISAALQRSRLIQALGSHLSQVAGRHPRRLLVAVMALAGMGSTLLHATTTTAVLVPPVSGAARAVKISASKLLIPLAYASMLGGTCTLIGTSTNIAVSGYLARHGFRPLGMFEFTPVGLTLLLTGIVYMVLIGQRLLPAHHTEDLADEYGIREYLTELVVTPKSHLVGQRIFESDIARMEYRILEVLRGEERIVPTARTVIRGGDILLVEGKPAELMKVKDTAGIEIRPDVKMADELGSDEFQVVEALVPRQSPLLGRTLKQVDFRSRYGMTVLAIYRRGQSLRDKVGRIHMRTGDVLLIQGPPERLESLRRSQDVWVLEELDPRLYRRNRGILVAGLLGVAVLVGVVGWVPLPVSLLVAAVVTVLSGAITVQESYSLIDWRLLVLIAGMTAFGTAMETSGAAEFLAHTLVGVLRPLGLMGILGGFLVITMLLSQPMSNAAAALVMLPVGIETAHHLGVNARTFAIGIMLAASMSLITPFEPSCILVYGAGRYAFRDFVRVGLPLTIVLVAIVLLIVPMLWPLAVVQPIRR